MTSTFDDQAVCHWLTPTALRVTQCSILLTLSAHSPMTANDLAAAPVLDRSTRKHKPPPWCARSWRTPAHAPR